MKNSLFAALLSFACMTASAVDLPWPNKKPIHFRFGVTDFYDPLLSSHENTAVRKSLLEGEVVTIWATYVRYTNNCPPWQLYSNGNGCGSTRQESLNIPYKIQSTASGEQELQFDIERLLPSDESFKLYKFYIDLNASVYNQTKPIKQIFDSQRKRGGGKADQESFDQPDNSLTLDFDISKISRDLNPKYHVNAGFQTTCLSVHLPVETPIYYYQAPAVIKLLWNDPSLSIQSRASGVRCYGGNSTSYEGKQTLSESLPKEIIDEARADYDRRRTNIK